MRNEDWERFIGGASFDRKWAEALGTEDELRTNEAADETKKNREEQKRLWEKIRQADETIAEFKRLERADKGRRKAIILALAIGAIVAIPFMVLPFVLVDFLDLDNLVWKGHPNLNICWILLTGVSLFALIGGVYFLQLDSQDEDQENAGSGGQADKKTRSQPNKPVIITSELLLELLLTVLPVFWGFINLLIMMEMSKFPYEKAVRYISFDAVCLFLILIAAGIIYWWILRQKGKKIKEAQKQKLETEQEKKSILAELQRLNQSLAELQKTLETSEKDLTDQRAAEEIAERKQAEEDFAEKMRTDAVWEAVLAEKKDLAGTAGEISKTAKAGDWRADNFGGADDWLNLPENNENERSGLNIYGRYSPIPPYDLSQSEGLTGAAAPNEVQRSALEKGFAVQKTPAKEFDWKTIRFTAWWAGAVMAMFPIANLGCLTIFPNFFSSNKSTDVGRMIAGAGFLVGELALAAAFGGIVAISSNLKSRNEKWEKRLSWKLLALGILILVLGKGYEGLWCVATMFYASCPPIGVFFLGALVSTIVAFMVIKGGQRLIAYCNEEVRKENARRGIFDLKTRVKISRTTEAKEGESKANRLWETIIQANETIAEAKRLERGDKERSQAIGRGWTMGAVIAIAAMVFCFLDPHFLIWEWPPKLNYYWILLLGISVFLTVGSLGFLILTDGGNSAPNQEILRDLTVNRVQEGKKTYGKSFVINDDLTLKRLTFSTLILGILHIFVMVEITRTSAATAAFLFSLYPFCFMAIIFAAWIFYWRLSQWKDKLKGGQTQKIEAAQTREAALAELKRTDAKLAQLVEGTETTEEDMNQEPIPAYHLSLAERFAEADSQTDAETPTELQRSPLPQPERPTGADSPTDAAAPTEPQRSALPQPERLTGADAQMDAAAPTEVQRSALPQRSALVGNILWAVCILGFIVILLTAGGTTNKRVSREIRQERERQEQNELQSKTPEELRNLGARYYFGMKMTRMNNPKGVKYLTQAAEAGDIEAQGILSYIHIYWEPYIFSDMKDNEDEKREQKLGIKLAHEAAETGNPYALLTLGHWDSDIRGDKDAYWEQAGEELTRRAKNGDTLALLHLGKYYHYHGFRDDNALKAAECNRDAANAGCVAAMYEFANELSTFDFSLKRIKTNSEDVKKRVSAIEKQRGLATGLYRTAANLGCRPAMRHTGTAGMIKAARAGDRNAQEFFEILIKLLWVFWLCSPLFVIIGFVMYRMNGKEETEAKRIETKLPGIKATTTMWGKEEWKIALIVLGALWFIGAVIGWRITR